MKCFACGYFHLEDWEIKNIEEDSIREQVILDNGGRRFSHLEIMGKVEDGSSYFSSMTPKELTLYVCPRCGTIKSKDYGVFTYGL